MASKPAAPAAPNSAAGLEVSKKPLAEVVKDLKEPTTAAEPTLQQLAPKTTAIYKVDSPLSQIYTHVHTPLLLSLAALNFPALVANPVETLAYTAPVVAALQSVYCGLCLQPVNIGSGKKGGAKKKKKGIPGSGASTPRPVTPTKKEVATYSVAVIAWTVIRALALSVAAALPMFALAVLLGAPLTTHLPHTLLLSLHASLLTLFPLFFARPLNTRHWLEICSGTAPFDSVYGATLGGIFGSWLGAVPIPLDWDRAWQAWPVTLVFGTYGGWAVGREIGKIVGGRWRADWETEADKEYEGPTVPWKGQ